MPSSSRFIRLCCASAFEPGASQGAVAQSVGGTLDAGGLDSWPELLRGLKAGLLMLGKTRAVELVEAIHTRLKPVMQPGGGALGGGGLDRLADAIVSLEYYMETLQAGRSDPWYMLDNAQASLEALDRAAGTGGADGTAARAERVRRNDRSVCGISTEHATAASAPEVGGAPAPRSRRPRSQPAAAPAPMAEHADPELTNLFIEEAREELARITQQFPLWEHNPLEQSALVTVRRSFHTLRAAAAWSAHGDLSEFAWAIENLLNRLLDNTLGRTPAITRVLHDAVAALPQLVEQLETGAAPRTDTTAIITRAHSLAAGRPDAASAAPAPHPETAEPAQPRAAATTPPTPRHLSRPPRAAPPPDDVLRDIYARETASHIAVVRAYLARETDAPEPHELPEDVYRACHTLSGSSKMAQARHGIRLAQPLDHWLRKAFDSGLGLLDSDLELLGDAMTAMESVASHLDESTGYFVTHGQLLERIGDAES